MEPSRLRKRHSSTEGEIILCSFSSCDLPEAGHCFNCRSAHYCSREHQSADWKTHKPYCLLYKREEFLKEGTGKEETRTVTEISVTASRDVKPGRQISSESPAVTFPNIDYKSTEFTDEYAFQLLSENQPLNIFQPKSPEVCFGCYKVETGGLPWVCYYCGLPLCSTQCEKATAHRSECHVIGHLAPKGGFSHVAVRYLYLDIAVLRILLLKENDKITFDNLMMLSKDPRIYSYQKGRDFNLMFNGSGVLKFLSISSAYTADTTALVQAALIALVMGHVNIHQHPT